MIKLLHGENIVQSRKRLGEILEKARATGVETVIFSGGKITLPEVRSALESGSLFGKTKLVVIENFLSSQKSNEKEKIQKYLTKGKFDNDLIFWEAKEVKSHLFKEWQEEIFKVAPLIFRFLESLRPGNAGESLRILSELKLIEEPEMIFFMLVRQFRFLFLASSLGPSGLSELSPWLQKKFLTQVRWFELKQLGEIYKALLEIDFNQKTSGDSYSFSSRLDLFVSEI